MKCFASSIASKSSIITSLVFTFRQGNIVPYTAYPMHAMPATAASIILKTDMSNRIDHRSYIVAPYTILITNTSIALYINRQQFFLNPSIIAVRATSAITINAPMVFPQAWKKSTVYGALGILQLVRTFQLKGVVWMNPKMILIKSKTYELMKNRLAMLSV